MDGRRNTARALPGHRLTTLCRLVTSEPEICGKRGMDTNCANHPGNHLGMEVRAKERPKVPGFDTWNLA